MASSQISLNVRQIARLEEQQLHARSASERIAGAVTRVAGTSVFAVAHLVWFASWILINSGRVARIKPFDPFPFNLLTLIVSLEAIFLSLWILISQNQMARQAERRAHLDLQINLLAEQESTATLRAVHGIAQHLGVDPAKYVTDPSLAEETDVEHLASRMDEAMPSVPGTSALKFAPSRRHDTILDTAVRNAPPNTDARVWSRGSTECRGKVAPSVVVVRAKRVAGDARCGERRVRILSD